MIEFKNLLHVVTWCTDNHLKVKTSSCIFLLWFILFDDAVCALTQTFCRISLRKLDQHVCHTHSRTYLENILGLHLGKNERITSALIFPNPHINFMLGDMRQRGWCVKPRFGLAVRFSICLTTMHVFRSEGVIHLLCTTPTDPSSPKP